MTYDEVKAVHDRMQLDRLLGRAQVNAQSYREVRDLFKGATAADAYWIYQRANRIRAYSRGVSLKRLRLLIERLTGEPLCW